MIDPRNLPSTLLTLIMRVSVVVGAIVYVPSVLLLIEQGELAVVAVDTLALGGVAALLYFDGLPFRFRATVACAVFYALGMVLLLRVGTISEIYLMGFSIITVLVLGLRAGLAATVLSSGSLLVVGGLGLASPDMAVPGWNRDVTQWLVMTGNFALINTVLTLAIGAILKSVDGALKREIAHGEELEREKTLIRTLSIERAAALAQVQLQIERMPLAYLLLDRDLRYTRWNPAAERMFGFSEAAALGKHPNALIVPEGRQAEAAQAFEALKASTLGADEESDNRTQAGATIRCEWHHTPMFDEAGRFAGVMSLAQDVTARRKLEEQLRQAQKLEGVGHLAGGVAHDFNNVLSIILSYADSLLYDLPPDAEARADAEEIRAAALRAAALTRQLLMFSRQQVVESRVLDLNEVVTGISKMLGRLVGEDIELTSLPDPSLGRILADPGSIEQVIMNLVVNARDAMPVGGTLQLATKNVFLDEAYAASHLGVTAGPHVMLSVSDTGTGIAPATLARIFEPFFTTKEKGKGTGLGLSTVFGIVKQSGGSIRVDSTVGSGTTFQVYLPRVDDAVEAVRPQLGATALSGTETILLVEDDDPVRAAMAKLLRKCGYTVLEANCGEAALARAAGCSGPIHLLLSDVVMPRMSGPILAKHLTALRPDLKVLCMSGFTDDAAFRHGVAEHALAFLQKPVEMVPLAMKVRSVLDAQAHVSGAAR